MRAILLDGFGDPDVLKIGDAEDPVIADDEVLIRVAATSVNRADCVQRQGKYPPPPGESDILGLEVAGLIERVGSGVTDWKVGDRVMSLVGGGGYATYAKAPASTLIRIPDSMNFTTAAGVCEVFITAYLNIFMEAGLGAQDILLIHGGASGVGTSGIQLARELGSRSISVTVGDARKAALTTELGADHAILYKEQAFDEAIKDITAGKGVDVILDHIGGGYLKQNQKSLAIKGRLVVIGLIGGIKAELNVAMMMTRRQRIIGSVLRARSIAEKAAITAEFTEKVMPLLEAGTIAPVIDRILPLEDAATAHQLLDTNATAGKVILTVDPELC